MTIGVTFCAGSLEGNAILLECRCGCKHSRRIYGEDLEILLDHAKAMRASIIEAGGKA